MHWKKHVFSLKKYIMRLLEATIQKQFNSLEEIFGLFSSWQSYKEEEHGKNNNEWIEK